MIILRDKLFTLPDSRKGIGWVNDKNGIRLREIL